MADKLFENDEMHCIRVQCDCLSASHAIDFCVEFSDNKKVVTISMNEYSSWRSWKQKVKAAIDVLRGREILTNDRILRPEDISDIIEILQKGR